MNSGFFVGVGKNQCGVVADVLNCDIVVNEFEIQSLYFVHFRMYTFAKGKKSLIPSGMRCIVSLLSFNKDGFDIK